jgi:hypothetical protein
LVKEENGAKRVKRNEFRSTVKGHFDDDPVTKNRILTKYPTRILAATATGPGQLAWPVKQFDRLRAKPETRPFVSAARPPQAAGRTR